MNSCALVGGMLLDGTGSAATAGDVLVRDGVIQAVGDIGRIPPGIRVQRVEGRCVAPGWIDVHSHGDDAPFLPRPDSSKVLQGITSEVVGNCGMSLAPRTVEHSSAVSEYVGRVLSGICWQGSSFADLLGQADARGYVTNYAPLVGHGTLRVAVAGFRAGALRPTQADRMAQMAGESMAAGAVGLSSGLIYPPGSFADTDELVSVMRVVSDAGGIYASHIRAEGTGRMAAVAEAIEIGRRSGARVEISHHKAKGPDQWGTIPQSLAAAAAAREAGVDVGFDAYPYDASSTTLVACLPPEMFGLDDHALLAALERPETIDRLREKLSRGGWDNHVYDSGGYGGILVTSTADGRFAGKTLAELGEQRRTDGAEALVHVLREERLHAGMISFAMNETDVRAALADEHTCIGSDSGSAGSGHLTHPRALGTFARVLGRYAREVGLLTIEEAVHRMTGLPAQRFRLDGIGRLAPGLAADIVVFDPQTVMDRATYENPGLYPVGVTDVLISGQQVVADGRFTGARAGRRLRLWQ